MTNEPTGIAGERPSPEPPRPYHFPSFIRTRLTNGLEIIVAPMSRLPLATIRIVFDAGASMELPSEAGIAGITAHALAEGTMRLDGAALAEEFERLGGAMGVSTSWDDASVQTTVLPSHFVAVLSLLAETILTPAFPDREVTRLRDQRLAELLELRQEPRGLADQMFESLLYVSTSRFALPEQGASGTVREVTAQRARRFHETRIRPGTTTIIVVGDLRPDEVIEHVTAVFGSWSGDPGPAPIVDTQAASEKRRIHVIRRPGAPQTELRVGHVGVPRDDPDFLNIVVMNAILGGVFNSRINMNLREKHGFAYGAFSAFEWRRSSGPFVASAAVATESSDRALAEMLNELNEIRLTPPDEKEVSLVTSYLDGVFPIRFETTEAIAASLAALKIFSLPNDYHDTYRARIRAVTPADVARAATKHVHPDALLMVALGDPDQIGKKFEALDIGSVEYVDPETLPL